MENQLQTMLEEELEAQIKNLSRLGSGTKEKASAVEDVTKLYRLKLEEQKDASELIDREKEDQLKREQLKLEEQKDASVLIDREKEYQLKREQLKRESIFQNIRLGTEIFIFIAEIGFASYWARRGFEFEKDGAFTSGTMKSLFSKFRFRNKN